MNQRTMKWDYRLLKWEDDDVYHYVKHHPDDGNFPTKFTTVCCEQEKDITELHREYPIDFTMSPNMVCPRTFEGL